MKLYSCRTLTSTGLPDLYFSFKNKTLAICGQSSNKKARNWTLVKNFAIKL